MKQLKEYINNVMSSFAPDGSYDVFKAMSYTIQYTDYVAEKLLTLNENSQKAYCRLILDYIWIGCNSYKEFQIIANDIENYELLSENSPFDEILNCLLRLHEIFSYFGIDLNKESIALNHKKLVSQRSIKNGSSILLQRLDNVKGKKTATAKTTEQVDVIRTLLKSAGVEYSADVNLAKFISWLCGGSADSIRINGLVPNTGYENEEVLKDKFALIGIEYEKGKIEQKANKL